MYAEIVLDYPIKPLFYRVTPEIFLQIQIGSLVEVLFGKKRAIGVVKSLRKKIDPFVKEKIKPITKLVSSDIWVDQSTFRLAQSISDYTNEPLGIALFRLLPPLSRKLPPIDFLSDKKEYKKYPMRIHLYGSLENRLDQYEKVIKKIIANDRQAMIIAPRANLETISNRLINLDCRLVLGSLPKVRQRQLFSQFRAGFYPILIGSRHIVGWSAKSLGMIIIDDPMSFAHVDDQRPYLDSTTLAYLRIKLEAIPLILGSSLPTLGMYLAEKLRRARVINSRRDKKILLSELRDAEVLTQTSLQIVRSYLHTKQKVILIAHRRGRQRLFCRNCRQSVNCPQCGHILETEISSSYLKCTNCQSQSNHQVCSRCRGKQIFAYGVGTDAIEQALNQEFGPISSNITVDTEQILDQIGQVTAVIFAFADSPLISPELNRPIEFLNKVCASADRADQIIIQTTNPQSVYWQTLKKWPVIFDQLLASRKQNALPPFYREITILTTGSNQIKTILTQLPKSYSNKLSIDNNGMIKVIVSIDSYQQDLLRIKEKLPKSWKIKTDSILNFSS